jgi:Tfp pilus assembly protein PilX
MKQISENIGQQRQLKHLATRQAGMATLLVTIILVVVSTLSALAVGRVVFFEQQITGTDLRNKEVYSAAIAGMEYGTNWMEGNIETWDFETAGGTATPTAMPNTTQGVDSYVHTITFTLLTDVEPTEGPTVIRLSSTATAVNDSQVTKTVQMDILQGAILTNTIADGPPLVVEECIPSGASIVGGTPDIHPMAPDYLSIATTGNNGATAACLDPGHFDSFDENGDPLPDVTAGSTGEGTPIWDSVFGTLTEADLISMAARDPATIIYVDGTYATDGYYGAYTGSTWHDDVGSNHQDADGEYDDQVILYFDSSAGCPAINGGTVIHGLVYFETAGCTSNGWGGGDVYGTVAVEGDLNKFNSNADLFAVDLSSFSENNGSVTFVVPIPGTWRDF